MGDYTLRQVSVPSRLAFVYCMILAAETDNRVPFDCHYLSERMGFEVNESVITPLITEGLLLASGARRLLAADARCSSLPTLLPPAPPDSEVKSRTQTKVKRVLRPISEDEKPSEKHFSFGAKLQVEVGPEWGKFKNYCLAHDKRYADFEAAFRNWLANAHDMKGRKS
jgi:hypothetical protein